MNHTRKLRKSRRIPGEKYGVPFTKEELRQRQKYLRHKKKHIYQIFEILCKHRKASPSLFFTVKEIKAFVDNNYAKQGKTDIEVPLSSLYRHLGWLWDNQYIHSAKTHISDKSGPITLVSFQADLKQCLAAERRARDKNVNKRQ